MANFFLRRGAAYINELNQSLGALLGIAQGLLADKELRDSEIAFLDQWLNAHGALCTTWPGDVVHARVSEVLANGHITDEERSHLVSTLQQLVGGTLDQLADSTHVTQLLPYEMPSIRYGGTTFCLTGDFACGPRGSCESRILALGGEVKTNVSKKLNYLVVGGLGSPEWKHGSFGTKVEKAMELKREGALIHLVQEQYWLTSLRI